MNKELQRDLGIAATSFTEYHKNKISSGSHKYREYWLMAQTELLAVFQDAFVKHKDKHAFDEMVFFSLVMGQSAISIMNELRDFEKEEEE